MIVVRDAVLLVLLATGLGLSANALRPSGGIPLVARIPYEVLRPCPEAQGVVQPLAATAVPAGHDGVLVLDARSAEEFSTWHRAGARSLPFDFLTAISETTVAELLKLHPRQVVVYGDGGDPDSGEQLARQIASQGLKNVFFVRGGAPTLRNAEGGKP